MSLPSGQLEKDIRVTDIDTGDGRSLTFTVLYVVVEKNVTSNLSIPSRAETQGIRHNRFLNVKVPREWERSCDGITYRSVYLPNGSTGTEFDLLFPSPPSDCYTGKPKNPTLGFDKNLDSLFKQSLAGFNGYATSYGDSLYLSAVVITTLGLGDIVPMNGWARFWVGVEAICGIVLAGLFINGIGGNKPQNGQLDL
jgi:ion channel